jgi:hypothetical protein
MTKPTPDHRPRLPLTRLAAASLLAASLLVPLVAPPTARADEGGGRTVFLASARENPDDTVTLPLYSGRTASGETVHYVIFESSDGKDAAALGVNHAAKLNNVRVNDPNAGSAAMRVTFDGGTVVFPATVDFAVNVGVPTPDFLPAATVPLVARGLPGYSPLIQLPDGTIRNAPQVANGSGQHPKVRQLDVAAGKVVLQETRGFAGGKMVKYVSTDASVDIAAALEGATLAATLNFAPFAGGDGTDSARASLAAFVNGQTGVANPQRQGLNSAIIDGDSPLNVLAWNPSQGRYSPLWDVHPAAWTAAAVASGQNTRQTDFGKVRNLVQKFQVTGPGGSPFGAAGIIVDCPIVSSD